MKEKDIMSFGLLFLFIGLVSGGAIILDVGTNTFNGDIEVNGNLTSVQNIRPDSSDTYNLGSASRYWNTLWVDNFKLLGNDVIFYIQNDTNQQLRIEVTSRGGPAIRWGGNPSVGAIQLIYSNGTTTGGTAGLMLWSGNDSLKNLIPASDNDWELGSNTFAFKNITAYDFTTKSSREIIVNPGNAIEQIKGIKALPDGKLDHDTVPEYYKVDDFFQVEENTYKTINDVPPDLRLVAERHVTISMNGRMDLLEAAVRELAAENELLKEELCIFDLGYEFCR